MTESLGVTTMDVLGCTYIMYVHGGAELMQGSAEAGISCFILCEPAGLAGALMPVRGTAAITRKKKEKKKV